jgi:hypothetical protein
VADEVVAGFRATLLNRLVTWDQAVRATKNEIVADEN